VNLLAWLFYAQYAVSFLVARREPSLILGLIITDHIRLIDGADRPEVDQGLTQRELGGENEIGTRNPMPSP